MSSSQRRSFASSRASRIAAMRQWMTSRRRNHRETVDAETTAIIVETTETIGKIVKTGKTATIEKIVITVKTGMAAITASTGTTKMNIASAATSVTTEKDVRTGRT